jgi:hypothetical protein
MAGVEINYEGPHAVAVDQTGGGAHHGSETYSSKDGYGAFNSNTSADRNEKTMRGVGMASAHELWPKAVEEDGGKSFRSTGSIYEHLNRGNDNPAPETWRYDAKGNLLNAGNSFYAQYDEVGNAVTAVMDGQVWEQTHEGVTHAYTGSDGMWQSQEIPGGKLSIKTYGEGNDRYQGAEVTIATESGSVSGLSFPLYERPFH